MTENKGSSGPDWLGLLKWTIAHSDGTSSTTAEPMDLENRKWLEEVMTQAVRDDPQRINEILAYINGLLSEGVTVDEEHLQMQLEDLRDIIEQIDMAQVFTKMGGVNILVTFIEAVGKVSVETKALMAVVIAIAAQNNPKVQQLLTPTADSSSPSTSPLDRLVGLYIENVNNFHLQNKLLYAISSIVKGLPETEADFVNRHARSVFSRVLHLEANLPYSQISLVDRSLFLMNALICSDFITGRSIEELLEIVFSAGHLGSWVQWLSDIEVHRMVADEDNHSLTLVLSLLQSFNNLLHTNSGWLRLVGASGYSALLTAALNRFKSAVQAELQQGSCSNDDVSDFISSIIEIELLLVSPCQVLYPKCANSVPTARSHGDAAAGDAPYTTLSLNRDTGNTGAHDETVHSPTISLHNSDDMKKYALTTVPQPE